MKSKLGRLIALALIGATTSMDSESVEQLVLLTDSEAKNAVGGFPFQA